LAFLANLFNEHVGLDNVDNNIQKQQQAEEAWKRNLVEEEVLILRTPNSLCIHLCWSLLGRTKGCMGS
jgi:hypothetical protein